MRFHLKSGQRKVKFIKRADEVNKTFALFQLAPKCSCLRTFRIDFCEAAARFIN
jgi:hypothetical protein